MYYIYYVSVLFIVCFLEMFPIHFHCIENSFSNILLNYSFDILRKNEVPYCFRLTLTWVGEFSFLHMDVVWFRVMWLYTQRCAMYQSLKLIDFCNCTLKPTKISWDLNAAQWETWLCEPSSTPLRKTTLCRNSY